MKILNIDSNLKKNNLTDDLREVLSERGHRFYYFVPRDLGRDNLPPPESTVKRVYFGPRLSSAWANFLFLVFLPGLWLYFFGVLFFWRRRHGGELLLLSGKREKIIFTPLGRLLSWRIVWLERPDENYQRLSRPLLKLWRRFGSRARLIVFTKNSLVRLVSFGLPEEAIKVIPPGIKIGQAKRQENIFNTLAKSERQNYDRKYFTLGAVIDYDQPNQLENLLQAIKICATVIPDLQLVVLGEGEGKKKMSWVAKKLEIESLVWFVGRQDNLRKWLEGFDVFISVDDQLQPLAIKLVLKAMDSALPVIGFSGRGFSDFIREEETGLLSEPGDSEMLANQIIRLYKNRLFLYKLGQRGRALVQEEFEAGARAVEFERELLGK